MNDVELAAYLDRRLAGIDRERVESHLAGCPICREELLQTHQLVRHSRRPRRLLIGSLIAAAAALILVASPGLDPRNTAAHRLRDAPNTTTMVAYGPIGESSTTSPAFVWAPADGATSYRLTITTAAGTLLYSVSSADTAVTLPDSVRLQGGERYLWVVDALLDNGSARSTGLREFHVVP